MTEGIFTKISLWLKTIQIKISVYKNTKLCKIPVGREMAREEEYSLCGQPVCRKVSWMQTEDPAGGCNSDVGPVGIRVAGKPRGRV